MQPVKRFWKRLRPHLAAVLLVALAVVTLREPITWWLQGEENYDQEALKEWLLEAKVYQTLPELVGAYLKMQERYGVVQGLAAAGGPEAAAVQAEDRGLPQRLRTERAETEVHLKALAVPPTQMYQGRLPLFPVVYRLAAVFDERAAIDESLDRRPIVWDSGRPRQKGQYR